MVQVSSGQRQLINLNDAKALQLFLSSNQPKTQLYNTNSGVYTPDWSSVKPVITAELYAPGSNTNIISSAKSVKWYEDNSTTITSGGNYTVGSGTLTINGNIIGQEAVAFDGSTGKATIPNSTSINISGSAFTFESWVFPRDYTNPAEVYLCNKENQYEIALRGNPRGLHTLQIAIMSGAAWNWMDSGASIPLKVWTHIAVTYDGTNIYFYVNGVLVATVANYRSGPITSGSSDLTLGARQAGNFTNEIMREVRLWNVVRAQADIAANMNSHLLGSESGLMGYWKMSEGTGTTINDSTSNANNGTLTSGATWITMGNTNKVITCEVVYTDPAVHTDLTVRTNIEFTQPQIGTTGVQGTDAPTGVLTNDTAVVTTANDGSGGTYGAPNTQTTFSIFNNGTDITSSYTIAQTRTNVTVTEATTSNVATVTAMSADTGSVVFTATRTYFPTITKTFSLAKSKMGVVGQTPTSYWLNVSSGTITAADDGSYTPGTLTVSAESQAGTGTPAAYSGRFIIAESTDGTNFTNKYTSSADESSYTYTPSAGLVAIKVTMYQAGGTSNKLDEQNIMIVGNGKNSVMVSAWTPQGNVIRNAANTVTAEADLLNGGQPVTGTNYRWVKGNGAATSVIAGAGYEDLDLGKRNLLSGTSESFQTVSVTSWSGPLGNGSQFLNLTLSQLRSSVGDTVTASLYINPTNGHGGFLRADYYKTDGTYNILPGYNIITTTTGAGYSHLTFTIGADFDHLNLYLGNENAGTNLLYNVDVKELKIEKSSTRTCWGLAYEDQPVSATDNTLYGRNLLRDSGFNNGVASWGVGANWVIDATQYISGYNVRTCDRTSLAVSSSTYSDLTQTVTLPADYQLNVPYTVSFWIKATAGTGSSLPFRWYFTNITSYSADNAWTPITATTGWTKVYRTMVFTTKQNNSNPTMYFRCFDGNAVSITQPKWEQTAYMTDYSPAPEDNSTLYPNGTAGVNNWVYRNYTDGSNATRKIYGYSDFPSLTPVYQTLIADGASLRYGDYGSYFVGYYKTAVYVSTAKTINYQFAQDDTINILVNGLQQGSQINTETTAQTYPLSLQAGWNTIELILQEIQGNDGIELSNTLSTLVEEMNCNYALDFGSAKGNYGLMGYNTSSMIVDTNAVTDTDLFECLVTYRGAVYKDSVTINDVTDPITMIINGSKLFKNNQGTNTYTAQLYQNGAEIDAGGTQYTYTWYVYNSDGSLDATFGGSGSKTGKTITLASSDINVKGKLQCQVSM